ncbi:thiamine pyrophosphate-dependent enzyme [Saccharopolyspora mangrovi]|uniref:Thiamine pyrophosphate-dependent enzyme n=1 Tax=Saccharopolyspora mangrovi TaxID=3082379 RepID=A0ABU6A8B8_9PSEU|nr:thiamine pyrophosphate-dependent enzyme [Saccharopolyspora sp. S2-29]MEB3367741.1 thiamine pyrophosphate-dependent enzyme [Saccharopolyspora sp. S2-29]
MRRLEALHQLVDLTENRPVVVTCAATSRELASIADRDNHLYLLDSMGLAGSVTTGLAMAVEDSPIEKVIGVEGDGSLLMNPNVLPTGGYTSPRALMLVLLDNRVYGSTAGLPTYADRIDLGAITEAAGWTVCRADDPETLREEFTRLVRTPGPTLLHVRIEPGNAPNTPKLLADPVTLTNRFQTWLAPKLLP